jgi:V/A-type H+-transporting ATPase subunit I
MAKVEIIGPRGLSSDVMCLIHEQGRLHIEDLSNKIENGDLPLDRMEIEASQEQALVGMDEMLVRIRAILKALEREASDADCDRAKAEYSRLNLLDADALRERVETLIDEVEERTAELAAHIASLESEDAQLARYEPILRKIQPLAQQIVMSDSYDSVALLFERRYRAAIDTLRIELERITHHQCEFQSTEVDQDTTAVIVVFAKPYSNAVHKFLTLENVNQIRLPTELEDMPFDLACEEIKSRRAELPQEIATVRGELRQMSEQWGDRLRAARDLLIDRSAEIEAIPMFGRTSYAFVITGWIPVSDLKALRKLVAERWGEDVIIEQTEIAEGDYANVPVALRNSKAVEPFQKLVGIYGMPRYGTVDPTWMLMVFYPLFFGMIVGDIGYGLIMLGIVFWLRLRNRDNELMQVATSVLGPAATMVVAFGFIYAEFFGDLLGAHYLDWIRHTSVLGLTLPFDRVHLVVPFMLVAIGVGVIHVMFGLVVGVINAIRTKSKHHLWEKAGILAFILGVGFAVALSLPLVTEQFGNWALGGQTVFALIAFGGFVFALRGGKVMGAIELIESVAHMASYIRIMAVGLAGAIFADAVNRIVAGMVDVPVLAVTVAVVLHSLNFVIASFSPTIHALRLNFLEFFGKFYETGGRQYEPFTKTGGEYRA